MTEISALEDRVPRYYGIVSHMGRSILLGTHDGENLEGRVMGLPHEMRDNFKSEVTKTMKMLHDGGVSHGSITAKNVIVQAGDKVKLVNFADAALKEDVEQYEWRNCMAMDKCDLKGIFDKAESAQVCHSVRNFRTFQLIDYRLTERLPSLSKGRATGSRLHTRRADWLSF